MRRWSMTIVVLGLGCGPTSSGEPTSTSEGSGSSSTASTASATSSPTLPATGSSTTESSTTSSDTASTGLDGTSSSGAPPFEPLDCDGTVYLCGNGLDDDGDGLIDLEDPECIGPCDDEEASFLPGLPGGAGDDCTHSDCLFDANTTEADDQCDHDLRCDPLGPGAGYGCNPNPDQASCQFDPLAEQTCHDACEPRTPPGCDCWGCCTVQTDAGPVSIFIGLVDGCSLDDLGACPSCTPLMDECGRPCDPGACLICFGESEPPPGCDDYVCPDGESQCAISADCPTDHYCMLGCCYPSP